MTIRLSTFTRNGMLAGSGFKTLFAHGCIEIRSGPQPTDADSAATGTLLGLVTVGAGSFTPGTSTNGLTFDNPVAGTISKAAAENWQWVGIADGIAGWFRLRGNPADAGAADPSFTLARMDGSIANSGADLLMSNVQIATGAPDAITQFAWTLLASAQY